MICILYPSKDVANILHDECFSEYSTPNAFSQEFKVIVYIIRVKSDQGFTWYFGCSLEFLDVTVFFSSNSLGCLLGFRNELMGVKRVCVVGCCCCKLVQKFKTKKITVFCFFFCGMYVVLSAVDCVY